MLVSELIDKLADFIMVNGDMPVCCGAEYNNDYPSDLNAPMLHDKSNKDDRLASIGDYDRWCGL